jgi:hypothetical protein
LLRIVAAWMFVGVAVSVRALLTAVLSLPSDTTQGLSQADFILPQGMGVIAELLVAAWLWGPGAPWIANRIWRGMGPVTTEIPLNAGDLQRSILAALGLYLMVHSLSTIAELVGGFYAMRSAFGFEQYYKTETLGRALGVLAQLGVGLWLLLGTRGIANALVAIRQGISRLRDAR